ncbi:hypothetical protein MKY95_19685 [Paenibacillus sp. FSL P4-0176]|uniref:hypothetical protein n=1 Tax=Paenibacillus sp. FSL P4-0176 TaxID=2921631 RepID=UPI0030CC1374
MQKIDFNAPTFNGFNTGEDLLVDTCILLALMSERDPWHQTVSQLFFEYIFPVDKIVLLYTNSLIVNEIMHLSTRSLKDYFNRMQITYNPTLLKTQEDFTRDMMKTFIDEEVLKVRDGDQDSAFQQIELTSRLGAADAANTSIANLYGLNFLTVDNKLVHNMYSCSSELNNIKKVYYTHPRNIVHNDF